MTKEILIKSALRALVNGEMKQGSAGYALEEDSAYEVSWKDVLEWLEQQPSETIHGSTYGGVSWGGTYIPKEEEMRDATEEERKSTRDYIDSISKPTGLRFDDMYEEIDFVQSHKKVPCTITIGKPCEDCISREALLNSLEEPMNWTDSEAEIQEQRDYEGFVELVKSMPSVIPQIETCEDCISRQAVLDEAFEVDTKEYGRTDVVGVDAIDALPSVTPSYNSIKTELDCVSRQAVDELSKELVHITRDKGDFLCNFWEELRKLPSVTPRTNLAETSQDVIDKIKEEILDEAEYAYADFDKYKEDILYAEPDELPDDDFRYGLRRAVEIINKYKIKDELKSEDLHLPPLYQIGFQDGYMRAIYDNNKGAN